MIGRLRGVVVEVEADDCLIDIMGVGYVVRCGAQTLARLPAVGEEAVLHTEHTWSADQGPRLYGFLTRSERAIYRLLTAIQGVGPKAALAVLDVLAPSDLATAVARQDKAAVARANGVGPKLAERIVVELKGKSLGADLAIGTTLSQGSSVVAAVPSLLGDAVAALMGLAIAEPLARRAVEHTLANAQGELDLSSLIRLSLRELGR